ncbi:MAG: hypothetical protein E6J92_02215 [Methanobacteriota archaeon]|nr:MAG: hypothetical protein E6K00_04925 [Euryarchaeota archaeon]TLZ99396.1 MAG: hypothetical protein E6J96_00895 [Euryarchaeota archaeon]TMA03323.1 MAG: hypothetical protein E6J92_02215 [Euryarchaeota archaeon]
MAWYGDADPRDERASFEATGSSRLWPFVLTVFFGILFAGIADLAWLTATGTNAPWFTSAVSAQVYTATLSTATIATLILASLAASKLTLLESRARATLARKIDEGAGGPRIPVEAPRSVVLAPSENPRAEGLDQILSELERFAEGPMVAVRDRQTGSPIPRPLPQSDQRLVVAGQARVLPRVTRAALRRARGLVWQTVAGPLAVLLIFISAAGAMLPGSGSFAQTHFQLNTGLILFLGYGWPFLVAWSIAAIALLHVLVRADSVENLAPDPMSPGDVASDRSTRRGNALYDRR